MAKKVVGDIAIQVGADISPLQKNMRKGSKSVKGFENDTKAMARKMAKVGATVVASASAMAVGILAAGRQAASTAREINNMATVANAGVVEFQKMAVAAETVGISQEKLSDILKDVNDRIGDFVETGGGPMADFFENIAPKIGVTIDQFQRLSGPEALQLYVGSLEKANLDQAQMTFYLEAMASDTTALIPLLRNGGSEIARLGDEAQKAGRIIDADLIKNGVELDKILGEASDTISTSFTVALLENADAIGDVAEFISGTLIPAAGDLLGIIGDITGAVSSGVGAVREFFQIVNGTDQGPVAGYVGQEGDEALAQQERDAINSGLRWYYDEKGNLVDRDAPEKPRKPYKAPTKGGGSSKGPTEEDFERMQAQFATEAEIIEEAHIAALEKLEEFRAAKLGKEEEFNELERRITEEHLEAKRALEEKAQAARLQSISGAFGDLSSLMQTNSKKLFEIGKAAAVAEATVSGYKSAVSAWEKGMSIGGPPVAAAFTAASLAKTGALIQGITSQTIGGGGAGSVPAGVGGADALPTRGVAEFKLVGNSTFDLSGLAAAINDATDQGYEIRVSA